MRRLHEMTYAELEKHAIEVISELKIKAYGAGYEQGKFDTEMDAGFKALSKAVTSSGITVGSDQDKRDRIVEQAKADINKLLDEFNTVNYTGLAYRVKPSQQSRKYKHHGIDAACDAEYIVNKEKRTVVVLMRGVYSGNLYAKGISKCAPNDCFNVHIGKTISLRRALGLDVPSEYMDAPQPTEVRVGDIVELTSTYGEVKRRTVSGIESDRDCSTIGTWIELGHEMKVIDDSREGGR